MRVLFDARQTEADGIGRYVRNLTRALAKGAGASGLELSVMGRESSSIPSGAECWECTSDRYTPEELEEFRAAIISVAPDVVHCPDYRIPVAETQVPIVVTIQDLCRFRDPGLCYTDAAFAARFGPKRFEGMKQALRLVSETIERFGVCASPDTGGILSTYAIYYRTALLWALMRADVILTASVAVKTDIERTFGAQTVPIVVAPYGIDHFDWSDPRVVSDDTPFHVGRGRFLIYVGSGRGHKRVPEMLGAFAKLANVDENLRLVIVGSDTNLYQMVRGHEASSRITITGYISDKALTWLYDRAAAAVHLDYGGGFGFPPLEAMSRGLGVVVAAVPAFKETLRDRAEFVDPNDAEDIARGVVKLLGSPPSRDLQQRHASAFRWSECASLTASTYFLAARVTRKPWPSRLTSPTPTT